ncbi:MAG: hypothetical protein ACYCS8_12770 [Acidithiobacillus sp.]
MNITKRSAFLTVAMAASFAAPIAHADTINPGVIRQFGENAGVPASLLKPAPQPQGTITVSGFAPSRMRHVLATSEGLMFNGRIGNVTATCAGHALHVSQTLTLYRVNQTLVRECPRGLSVTFTSHKLTAAEFAKWKKSGDSETSVNFLNVCRSK